MQKLSATRLISLLLMASAAGSCAANPIEDRRQGEEGPAFHYLLGAAANNHPSYFGAIDRDTKLGPLWSVRYGRWQINSSGAGALMGLGRQLQDAGANTELGQFGRVRLALGLRIDGGRKSANSASTVGLPDVRRTLRGRLGASWAIEEDWRLGASVSSDVLGRGGGMVYASDISYRLYQGLHSNCALGLQVQAGDASYMRSFFGTSTYQPGSGARDIASGVNCNQIFAKHWILFGSANVSQMLGPAADSPLTQRRGNYAFSIGIAWRN